MLDFLRGALPAPLKDWWPDSRRRLALRDAADDGVLTLANGRRALVLGLRGLALDEATSGEADLMALAAALNALRAAGATLLSYGADDDLAPAAAARDRNAAALAARRDVAPGYALLAAAQAAHLRRLGASASPARRYGHYLVLEAPDRTGVLRQAVEAAAAFDADLVRGAEAVAVEADLWRGVPLTPAQAAQWLAPVDADYALRWSPDGAAVVRG